MIRQMKQKMNTKKAFALLTDNKEKKTKQDDKVSLMNVLKNALINNDNNTIEWALKQNNELIEATVIAMENEKELISTFISKLIELIQSNHFYDKKNILVWIDTLFKFHFYLIMSLPQSTVNSLKNIKMLFENRTKYLHRLIEADAKFENFMSLLNTKKNVLEDNCDFDAADARLQ